MRFPDAEGVVIAHLNERLAADGDTARASTRVPGERPGRLVRVMLTGSARTSVAHRDAQVTVECWDAAGSVAALGLAEKVADWLTDLDRDGCHVPQGPAGWLGGPYSDQDPDTKTPRYVMTVIVRMRGQ